MWLEPNEVFIERYGQRCFICFRPTAGWRAPLGIISGRFPCCFDHYEDEVRDAWTRWLEEAQEQAVRRPVD